MEYVLMIQWWCTITNVGYQSFERKTSLFSLALAEVLMINMWVHDVGRFEGANYGLLKIVFELNLQLFQSAK